MRSLNLNVNHPGGCQANCQAAVTAQATELRLLPESGCVRFQDTVQQVFLPFSQAECSMLPGQRPAGRPEEVSGTKVAVGRASDCLHCRS